jgi:uncharacterized protein YkwD
VAGRELTAPAGGVDAAGAPDQNDRLRPRVIVFAFVPLLLASCATAPGVAPATSGAPQPAEDRSPSPPPASARAYTAAAQPDGVVGGPRAEAVARDIAEALRARGDAAQPDGALAAVAAWMTRQTAGGWKRGLGEVAMRTGFVGVFQSAAVFLLDGDQDAWRSALADVATNMPVTRYGLHVSDDGVAAVVFGRVEVTLDPIPRRFQPGEVCRLRGEITGRDGEARVYLTRPDGKVEETRLAGRKVDVALSLRAPGVHRVEVMSDGAAGPVVLVNVPIYVGVDEPAWTPRPAPGRGGAAPSTRAVAVARLLALLNEARGAAGLAPLAADAELGAVAAAHTEDMIAQRFFGHVSPSTGKVENRLRRAGVVASLSGENIGQAATPDDVHRVLMDSPAHRALMLGAKFTHVGIGAGFRPGEARDVTATLVFARRPPPPPAPVTAALATGFISSLRRARGAGPIAADPVFQRAAEAGLAAFTGGSATTPDQAIAVAHDALARESRRLRRGHGPVCIELLQVLELDELEDDPLFAQPRIVKMGLATATRPAGNTVKIILVVLAEGAACR